MIGAGCTDSSPPTPGPSPTERPRTPQVPAAPPTPPTLPIAQHEEAGRDSPDVWRETTKLRIDDAIASASGVVRSVASKRADRNDKLSAIAQRYDAARRKGYRADGPFLPSAIPSSLGRKSITRGSRLSFRRHSLAVSSKLGGFVKCASRQMTASPMS